MLRTHDDGSELKPLQSRRAWLQFSVLHCYHPPRRRSQGVHPSPAGAPVGPSFPSLSRRPHGPWRTKEQALLRADVDPRVDFRESLQDAERDTQGRVAGHADERVGVEDGPAFFAQSLTDVEDAGVEGEVPATPAEGDLPW